MLLFFLFNTDLFCFFSSLITIIKFRDFLFMFRNLLISNFFSWPKILCDYIYSAQKKKRDSFKIFVLFDIHSCFCNILIFDCLKKEVYNNGLKVYIHVYLYYNLRQRENTFDHYNRRQNCIPFYWWFLSKLTFYFFSFADFIFAFKSKHYCSSDMTWVENRSI